MAIAVREVSRPSSSFPLPGLQEGGRRKGEGLRRVRADALPEHTRYMDDGCDIHPHCLTCPLPRCRYDEPGGLRALLNAYRDQQILALRQRGLPVETIARRFHLSRRTVFRILSKGNGHRKTAATLTLSLEGEGKGEGDRPRWPPLQSHQIQLDRR